MAGKIRYPAVAAVELNDGSTDIVTGQLDKNSLIGRIDCPFRKKSPDILLDFGRKVTGYLEITTGAHSRDWIHIWYGPTADCSHIHHIQVKMPDHGVYQTEHYIACRYVHISIESDSMQPQDVSLELRSVKMFASQYPVSRIGSFECDDSALNTIWRRGTYTLELCMQKNSETCWYRMKDRPDFITRFANEWKGRYGDYVIYDGPRRDREAWLGDIRTEALVAYTAFASYDICKSSIDIFADLQRRDGSTVGDAANRMNFTEYNFWGIIAIWENYLYTGDRAFLEHIYPFVKNLISFIDSHMDERGFIPNDGHWMWTLPREGCNAGTQAILARALECAALIVGEFYDEAESERLSALSRKVKEEINRTFWNEEKGVYEDKLRIKIDEMPILLDINCYAVIFGIASEEKVPRILQYLKDNMWTPCGSATLDRAITDAALEDGLVCYPLTHLIQGAANPKEELLRLIYLHNRTVWPFINAYEVEARLKSGDFENALELIKRCWDHDYFDETDTYWEFVDPKNPVFNPGSCYYLPKDDCYNSAAHGWSGWVAYLMQTYILGVMPQASGFSKVTIEPQTGTLNNIRGTVPTPIGLIKVSIEKDADTYALTVEHPAGMEVELCLAEKELGGRTKKVTINKKA